MFYVYVFVVIICIVKLKVLQNLNIALCAFERGYDLFLFILTNYSHFHNMTNLTVVNIIYFVVSQILGVGYILLAEKFI